jgi:hypothetical protein
MGFDTGSPRSEHDRPLIGGHVPSETVGFKLQSKRVRCLNCGHAACVCIAHAGHVRVVHGSDAADGCNVATGCTVVTPRPVCESATDARERIRGGTEHMQYQDLAPMILRQRLVVEGYPASPITDEQIKEYLAKLSNVTGMTTLIEPVTHRSDLYGWAGWIHWETSGAHFYAWEIPLFFSVDLYTCKAFDPNEVVEFTRQFFAATTITRKEF